MTYWTGQRGELEHAVQKGSLRPDAAELSRANEVLGYLNQTRDVLNRSKALDAMEAAHVGYEIAELEEVVRTGKISVEDSA